MVPFLFLAEVIILQTYGVFCVLPAMFGDKAIYQQIIGTIMIVEIFVNWFLVGITSTSFESTSFPREDLKFEGTPKGVSMIKACA